LSQNRCRKHGKEEESFYSKPHDSIVVSRQHVVDVIEKEMMLLSSEEFSILIDKKGAAEDPSIGEF